MLDHWQPAMHSKLANSGWYLWHTGRVRICLLVGKECVDHGTRTGPYYIQFRMHLIVVMSLNLGATGRESVQWQPSSKARETYWQWDYVLT